MSGLWDGVKKYWRVSMIVRMGVGAILSLAGIVLMWLGVSGENMGVKVVGMGLGLVMGPMVVVRTLWAVFLV
ncbi:hypothetical protein A2899_05130 [Candidatus Amesbacteria bacterium RIFCSPLOWO2_01_FULL_49_25]|uniref:Uncharacterized protein n=1 Tax=Candidatus Amesbacteria bacterium RIFCSPHIGHO2_01_FULL_48_32b TaxID=1797253 RepID=A0A1F4YF59_9BACT|nr:MAG: hypothetical protein A2876_02880 [Candidatus Amesbacteria bacterium RIFCSPHIGHO2_01_FULL_48_32b]OGD07811.1 MAG: hypothetical protein A2899_05130 [Candidatus Amesbacteria bacterium RIFCSPLOWO2_01_FULL_49_25]